MDYSKIKLDNERNSHVTKRLNRLNTWKFFKVIYRENIWRMFGYNFLMIICLLPIFVVLLLGSYKQTELQQSLPMLNGFGFSTGVWVNLDQYIAARAQENNFNYGWLAVAGSMLITVILSGGFAVIRDAFWTGKLSTVGVFKSMWKGIKANILYGFVANVIISLSVFGIYVFFVAIKGMDLLWLAIVGAVVLGIIALFVAMYLLVLCSVTVTYKQSVKQNLSDSWRLMWLNTFPNLIHLVLALIPVALYFVFQNGLFQQLYLIVLLMFGGLYFPLVWQTHMMKTFALFHPVEVKKKKQAKQQQAAVVEAEVTDAEAAPAEEQAQTKKSKIGKGKKAAEVKADDAVEAISESEADAYAISDDAYSVEENKDE